MHHDPAKPHVANFTKDTIKEFGWEELCNPAKSPDLAPSDYHIFHSLKNHLAGTEFKNEDEARNFVQNFFDHKTANWYANGINQLPTRWAKVIECNGYYFDESNL